jgi:hypothetical protein
MTEINQELKRPPPPPLPRKNCRSGMLELFGERTAYLSAKEAVVRVLRELQRRDSVFLLHLMAHPENRGKKRMRVSKSREAIYPGRSDLTRYAEPLCDGYFVDGNTNTATKLNLLMLAARVANLHWGHDIKVDF